jgi:tripartite-type tricarboxylate transporter receptor subunit TctC
MNCRRASIALMCLVLATTAAAQEPGYPARTIKVVVPFAAGGPADTLARPILQRLSMALGQSVIIDNRPGAGGTIASKAVAAADPDGYTLLFGNTATFAVGPAVYTNIGYDPIKQFAPIALATITNNVLAVRTTLPVKSVPELISYARANPGKVNFASPGHGTPPHMIGEMFKQRAGIDITHVPYRGTAAALTDMISGQMDMTFENPSVVVPLVQDGKLNGLAVTGETRNAQLPNLPTMVESGLAGFVSTSFTGLVAPAGTSPDIIGRLNAAINAGLASPELSTTLAHLGVGTKPGSPEDFGAFLISEVGKWAGVAKRGGIRVD